MGADYDDYLSEYEEAIAERAWGLLVLFLIVAAAVAGALAAVAVHNYAPSLTGSLLGPVPKGFWYFSRASGFVSYVLIWISMVMGLLITNRLARMWPGGPAAFDLHQHASLLGVGFAVFHTVILLGDPKVNMRIEPLLVPFVGFTYRPLWIGIGQITLYLMLVVAFSFYVRKWIGKKSWRAVHFVSFLVFVGVLLHGLHTGPDSEAQWAQALYWVTGASTVLLCAYRAGMALRKRRGGKGKATAVAERKAARDAKGPAQAS